MAIKDLTALDTIQGGDQIAVGSTSNGDDRRSSITTLQTYMQSNLTFASTSGVFTTQYSTPLTGANIAVTDGASDNTNVHLIVTPAGTIATLTITLPASSGAVDKQEVLVNCTQIVTTLTVAPNGASSATGAPVTLAANDFFRMKYDLVNTIWYRIA